MAVPTDDGTRSVIAFLSGGAGGVVTALVAFRTRLAMMQRDIDDNKKTLTALQERIDTRLQKMDKRQIISLELMADIARKVGVDGRFSDHLVRFLASENEETDERRGGNGL